MILFDKQFEETVVSSSYAPEESFFNPREPRQAEPDLYGYDGSGSPEPAPEEPSAFDFIGVRVLGFEARNGSKKYISDTLLYTSANVTETYIAEMLQDELLMLTDGGINLLGYGNPATIEVHNAGKHRVK